MILNPTVSREDKINVMSAIAEKNKFSKTIRKFLGFVANKNRLFFLEKITDSFLSLVSKSKGELKAKIISSKELMSWFKKLVTFFVSSGRIGRKYIVSI